jgi:hypothetical protein
MASSIQSSTLTVTISEDLLLNGRQQGSTTTKTISGINEVMSFIKTCPDDKLTNLLTFQADSSIAGSYLAVGDVKYIRLTNLDASVDCEVSVGTGGSDYAIHKLGAGQSYVLMTGVDDTFEIGAPAALGSATAGMDDITYINAHCYAGAVDVEVFVASV